MPALILLLVAGCAKPEAATPPPPPEVAVVDVQLEDVPVSLDLRGRIAASRTAEVRARVTGIVLERVFEEGDLVQEGDVLFRIDPAPFRAAYDQASARVTAAEADLAIARRSAERLAPLAESKAISAQTYDDATTAVTQAEAALKLAKAAAKAARLDLGYTSVTAPISGRIGRAMVTEGALVSGAQNTWLATIVQLDPVYVDLSVPVSELLTLRRAQQEGAVEASEEQGVVSVRTTDGAVHPHPGSLLFTDVTVDPSTGNTLLRASVPNPGQLLLPGMYVQAEVTGQGSRQAARVPHQAVQRDATGSSVVVVVDGKAERRPVAVATSEGTSWIVTDGLSGGEQVVTEGFQKLRVGQPVRPTPWNEGDHSQQEDG